MNHNLETAPVLECSQPAVINQNLMDVGANVLRITRRLEELPRERGSLSEVKAIRAQLNKDIASWETQRKLARAAALVQYEQANQVYQDVVAGPLKRAEGLCKDFVECVEGEAKQKCEAFLREYFRELCQAKGIYWLPFERLGIKVTLAMADQKEPKKAMEMIRQKVNQVDQDLRVITGMENYADILAEYEKTLDLSSAISNVNYRKQAAQIMQGNKAEWDKVQQENHKTMQHLSTKAPEAVQVIQQEQEKRFQVTFAVTATMPMLRGLKAFLAGHNYEDQEGNE